MQAQPIWEEAFKKWGSEEILELFKSLGSLGAQVNTFKELFAHPQMVALDMVPGDGRSSHGQGDVCCSTVEDGRRERG